MRHDDSFAADHSQRAGNSLARQADLGQPTEVRKRPAAEASVTGLLAQPDQRNRSEHPRRQHAPPGNQSRMCRKIDEARLRLARGTHQLLHLVYGNAARQLGHTADMSGTGAGRRPASGEQGWPEPSSGSEPHR
jgi:hypothetical protein